MREFYLSNAKYLSINTSKNKYLDGTKLYISSPISFYPFHGKYP